MNIRWIGVTPDQGVVDKVVAEVEGIPLDAAADLVFHTVILGEDYDDGPCVVVWGEEGSDELMAEYFEKPEWVTLSQLTSDED